MARIPASRIGAGVSKSGSPAERAMTGLPSRFSAFARADMARVADGCIAATRGLISWTEVVVGMGAGERKKDTEMTLEGTKGPPFPSRASSLFAPLSQPRQHRLRHERRHVATEAVDLADERRTRERVILARREEDGDRLLVEPLVRDRHAEFVVEVGHLPDPAHEPDGTELPRPLCDQPLEHHHVEPFPLVVGPAGDGFVDERDALLAREEGALVRVDRDGHFHAVEQAECAAEHVEVAVRDGVERAGVEREAGHGDEVGGRTREISASAYLSGAEARRSRPGAEPSDPTPSLQ